MRAYTVVGGGRVGRRSEAILLIKRWGIDPNKLAIKPDESLRTIALQPRFAFPQMSACIGKEASLMVFACTYARHVARVYVYVYDIHPLFPVCRLVEVGDSEGGPKRGGAREGEGE